MICNFLPIQTEELYCDQIIDKQRKEHHLLIDSILGVRILIRLLNNTLISFG